MKYWKIFLLDIQLLWNSLPRKTLEYLSWELVVVKNRLKTSKTVEKEVSILSNPVWDLGAFSNLLFSISLYLWKSENRRTSENDSSGDCVVSLTTRFFTRQFETLLSSYGSCRSKTCSVSSTFIIFGIFSNYIVHDTVLNLVDKIIISFKLHYLVRNSETWL